MPSRPVKLGMSALQLRRAEFQKAKGFIHSGGQLELNIQLAVVEKRSEFARTSSMSSESRNRYEVHEVISQGSTSVVHRARDRNTGRIVAMKVLRTVDIEVSNIARSEYEILRKVKHPNILEVLDFFTTPNSVTLVTEFVDGLSLAQAVGVALGGRVEETVSRHLYAGLLRALCHLHRQNVVHRDVKPENVLVCHELKDIRLCDFNTAKSIEDGCALTMTGTLLYAAPEVLLGTSPGLPADIWGMGLCLYYMVSGKIPQRRQKLSPVPWLMASVARRPIGLSGGRWKSITQQCRSTLHTCLALHEAARPTADVLLKDEWLLLPMHVIEDASSNQRGFSAFSRQSTAGSELLSPNSDGECNIFTACGPQSGDTLSPGGARSLRRKKRAQREGLRRQVSIDASEQSAGNTTPKHFEDHEFEGDDEGDGLSPLSPGFSPIFLSSRQSTGSVVSAGSGSPRFRRTDSSGVQHGYKSISNMSTIMMPASGKLVSLCGCGEEEPEDVTSVAHPLQHHRSGTGPFASLPESFEK